MRVAGGLLLVVLVACRAHDVHAQDALAAVDTLRFEVASVRPHRSADDVIFALQYHDAGRFTATGTLATLIRTAYRVQESQLLGASGWMNDERFDIDARAGHDATPEQMRVMLRALLAARFALALHQDGRETSIYALRLADTKRGARARLTPAAEHCAAPPCSVRFAPGVLSARGVTMAMLASELSMWVDRIVGDRTGVEGVFDVDLEWAPDRIPQAPAMSATVDPPVAMRLDPHAPSIFTALREQLGLSLEPERGHVDVLVIDRAERPTAN
jgi:uncharacterized protein (TIGR03435 family)